MINSMGEVSWLAIIASSDSANARYTSHSTQVRLRQNLIRAGLTAISRNMRSRPGRGIASTAVLLATTPARHHSRAGVVIVWLSHYWLKEIGTARDLHHRSTHA